MPKKSKVNKLARMSDEERAKYLQHRADLEEEARRRKQELIARFIKNKLDKEEAYSRKNTAKLNQMWRFILRKIKCRQTVEEIQGMMSSFNFMMERKRRLISTLMASIEDSNDQHRRAFQAHTETISDFLDVGKQRLDKLHDEYEYQKNVLLENWEKQDMDITDNQNQAEMKLQLIVYVQDRNFKDHNKDKELERATIKNDARLEHEEEMHALRSPKVREVDMYWTRLREVFSSYVEHHNPIIGHYHQLQEKDDFYQRDIVRNERQIESDSKLVVTLQREYVKTTNNMSSKITRMNERKDDLSRRYWKLKKDSKVDRSRSQEQLLVLVDVSQDVIQRMEEAKRKLDKIQQLSNICRKYENEKDTAARKGGENSRDNERAVMYDNLDEDMVNECKEYNKLDQFLLKINHVRVQTMCLKAEKTKLSKENVQLKNYIKKYLTELALKNENQRPISVKLQSEMYKNEKPKINRPVTCIEGAVCNAVMHEQRMKILDKRNKDIGQIRAYPRVQNWM